MFYFNYLGKESSIQTCSLLADEDDLDSDSGDDLFFVKPCQNFKLEPQILLDEPDIDLKNFTKIYRVCNKDYKS